MVRRSQILQIEFQTLRRIRERHPDLPVVMVTDHTGFDTAVEAMKLGAQHYASTKPNVGTLPLRARIITAANTDLLAEVHPGRAGGLWWSVEQTLHRS
ncbi:MAG TPA: hypothetical protein PLG50_05300 [bacterium]|nr:hypothetical protein [bacterium]HQG45052.1 hypothetical protein [bacterium]HQI47953.1 hypothetical protein [bacterium]HQJ64630.1 hypothetical protein [bacterium]